MGKIRGVFNGVVERINPVADPATRQVEITSRHPTTVGPWWPDCSRKGRCRAKPAPPSRCRRRRDQTGQLAVPPADQLRQVEPSPEFVAAQRATVEAAERQVRIAEQGVRIARGAYLPNVSLNFNYGRQLFPSSPFNLGGDWRTDFSAGLGVQMPIFNGGRTRADVRLAQQSLEQSRLQLAQLQEITELRLQQAQAERERASAEISARQQTVSAAERVYNLTRLRYQQGLATQLEVSDARVALLQARVNLAQALTSFYAADAQLMVTGGAAAPTATSQAPQTPTAPSQSNQRRP